MHRQLSLRHVEMIYAIMITGSVTGAAARLYVTPPAISNLLREAEDRLEFSLFERQGGRMAPTERARLIFAEIERSFTGLASINEVCSRLHREGRRKIVIVSTPAFATSVLPAAIRAYQRRDQSVHFSILNRSSEYVQSLVASHKADIGFALDMEDAPGVHKDVVIRQRAMCLLPPDHPLGRRAEIHVEDLKDQPMIGLSGLEHVDDRILEAFASQNLRPPIVAECPAALMACAMVACGSGFAILDAISTHLFRNSGIIFKPFNPAIHSTICAYWTEDRYSTFDRASFMKDVHVAAGEIAGLPR